MQSLSSAGRKYISYMLPTIGIVRNGLPNISANILAHQLATMFCNICCPTCMRPHGSCYELADAPSCLIDRCPERPGHHCMTYLHSTCTIIIITCPTKSKYVCFLVVHNSLSTTGAIQVFRSPALAYMCRTYTKQSVLNIQ